MSTQQTYQNGLYDRSQTGFSQYQPRGPLDHYQEQRPYAVSQVQPRGPLDHYQEQRPQANTVYVRQQPGRSPVYQNTYQDNQRLMQNTYEPIIAPQVANVRQEYVRSSSPVAVTQVQTKSPIRVFQPPITKTFSEDISVPQNVKKIPSYLRQQNSPIRQSTQPVIVRQNSSPSISEDISVTQNVKKIPSYLRQSNSPIRQSTQPVIVRQNSSPSRVIQEMEAPQEPVSVSHATKQAVHSSQSKKMAEAIYEILIKEALEKSIKQAYNSKMLLEKEKLRSKQMQVARDQAIQPRGRSSGRNSSTRSASRSNSGIRNVLGSIFSGKAKGKVFVNGKIDVRSENGLRYLQQSFDTFDMNNDKKLEAVEIYQSLNKMCPKTQVTMGQVEGLMKEFDSNHDGSIDFNEFKDMVEAVQNGKLAELNSDEEIQAPKDTREEEFERIMEVNRQLELENKTLISQSQMSGRSENEQRLHEELAEQQLKEKAMLAQIEELKRQNLQMSQVSSQQQAPQQIRLSQSPERQPYQFSASQYTPIGEQYLTNTEAKLAARNQIVNRVPKEQLANQEYCKYLDQRFDYSFNKLKGKDDKISESQIPDLLNDMLSV